MVTYQMSRKSALVITSILLILLSLPAWHQAVAGSARVAVAEAASDTTTPILLFDQVRLPQGKKKAYTFNVPFMPKGRDGVLTLNARIETAKVAGHTPALTLTLNGTRLAGTRLINKPARALARSGQVYSMAAGARLTTYYSPDFISPDKNAHYGLMNGVKACEFQLKVTNLLREGKNELIVQNLADPRVQRELVVANARIDFRELTLKEQKRRPAPTGPLKSIEPRATLATQYTIESTTGNNLLRITVGHDTFEVLSRFSTPEPEWATGSNRFFKHERQIEKTPEAIIVRDTFTNLTGKNLALMQRHEVAMDKTLDRVWLAGLMRPARTGSVSEPSNPTTFATTRTAGIGMLAMSDVMRIHVTNYATERTIGIADNHLALKPGAIYTAQWAIMPVERPNYWRFLNTARRLMNANFTIDGAFCFFRASPKLTEPWTDEQTRDFLVFKDALYACASIGRYKGRYAHGTAFQLVDHAPYIRAFARRRRLVPSVRNLVYFHCFLDVLDESPERFADARILRPDGTQADYGKPYQRLFFPTEENSYGPAITKNIDVILDKIGADGVYWDEHEYSAYRYHFGEPWDGVSCDVDPKRMTITRVKSSVTLLSESWRLALAKRVLARGPLVGNGVPYTKAMAALKFPCFVETGSITNCARAQLYSPIALGDHLTERSEQDAYRMMLDALDYGCVYHWYNDMTVIPTHHTLTRYMYPITPIELHAGTIIGKERIVTKASGLFGWGDDSKHEVHLFDQAGREVKDANVPFLDRNGRTLSEIRLPENWSAVIIRQ